MTRPVVYIAGPFRGPDSWIVEAHIRKAEELAMRVAMCCAVPLCPHTMFRFFNGTVSDTFWLDATMELLRRCDAVMLTDDWYQSTGAKAEEREAREKGLPVFHSYEPDVWDVFSQWIASRST